MRASARLAAIGLILGLVSTTAIGGEIIRETVYSPALGRDMRYQVYLPKGYASGQEPLGVVYLLHGAGGDEQSWMKLGRIKATVDRLIAEKAVPPVILVMPGCDNYWWVDGPRVKAESALWQDLMPAIETRYRTRKGRQGRFFAGLSAGGYGAIRFALKYPDRISAAAALSPAIYRIAPPPFSAARRNTPFLNDKGHFSLAAWQQRNYPRYLAKYAAQPARVPIYLMSGRQDRYGIASEVEQFYGQVETLQPADVHINYVEGGHKWGVWADAIGGALIYMLNRPETASDFR